MQADFGDLGRYRERLGLARDCSRCAGLCCVALSFRANDGFPVDKPAGTPCLNLLPDFGCRVHAELGDRGLHGCLSYDCLGAGQRITQGSFAGHDWRTEPATAQRMFQELPARTELHLWLWYLTEAVDRARPSPLRTEVAVLLDRGLTMAAAPDELSWGEVDRLGRTVLGVLDRVGADIRSTAGALIPVADQPAQQATFRGAALPGADLRGADLRCADLRWTDLSGADLRGADLRWTDLMGTDLRRTDLSGANLVHSLFLTRSQLESAVGDGATLLTPGLLDRPRAWKP